MDHIVGWLGLIGLIGLAGLAGLSRFGRCCGLGSAGEGQGALA